MLAAFSGAEVDPALVNTQSPANELPRKTELDLAEGNRHADAIQETSNKDCTFTSHGSTRYPMGLLSFP